MVTIAKEFRLGTDFPKIDHAMWHKQVEVELKGAIGTHGAGHAMRLSGPGLDAKDGVTLAP